MSIRVHGRSKVLSRLRCPASASPELLPRTHLDALFGLAQSSGIPECKGMARAFDGLADRVFRGRRLPVSRHCGRLALFGTESGRFSGHSVVEDAVAAGSAGILRRRNITEAGWQR